MNEANLNFHNSENLKIPLCTAVSKRASFVPPEFTFTTKIIVKIRPENKNFIQFDREITVNYILFIGTTTGEIVSFIIYQKNSTFHIKLFAIIDISKHKINSIVETQDYMNIHCIACLSDDGSISIISIIDQIVLAHYSAQFLFKSNFLCPAYIMPNTYIAMESDFKITFKNVFDTDPYLSISVFVPKIINIQSYNSYIIVYQANGNFVIFNKNYDSLSMELFYCIQAPYKNTIISPNISFFIIFDNNHWAVHDGTKIFYEHVENDDIINISWLDNTIFCVRTEKNIFKYKITASNQFLLTETMRSNGEIKLEYKFKNNYVPNQIQKINNSKLKTNNATSVNLIDTYESNDYLCIDDIILFFQQNNQISILKNSEIIAKTSISENFQGNVLSLHTHMNNYYTIDMNHNISCNGKIISENQDCYRIIATGEALLAFSKSNIITNITQNRKFMPFTDPIRWILQPDDKPFFVFVTKNAFCYFNTYEIVGSQSFKLNIIDAFFLEDNFVIVLENDDCLVFNRQCKIISKILNYQKLKSQKSRLFKQFVEFPGFSTVAQIYDIHNWDQNVLNSSLILSGDDGRVTIPVLENFDIFNFTDLITTQIFVLSLCGNNKKANLTPSLYYLAVFASANKGKIRERIINVLKDVFLAKGQNRIIEEIEYIRKNHTDLSILIIFVANFVATFKDSVKLIPQVYKALFYKICLSDFDTLTKISVCFDYIDPLINSTEFLISVYDTYKEKSMTFMKMVRFSFVDMCFKKKNGVMLLTEFLRSLTKDEIDFAEQIILHICRKKEKKYKDVLEAIIPAIPVLSMRNNIIAITNCKGVVTTINIETAEKIIYNMQFNAQAISISPMCKHVLLVNNKTVMLFELPDPYKVDNTMTTIEISEIAQKVSWTSNSVSLIASKGKVGTIEFTE